MFFFSSSSSSSFYFDLELGIEVSKCVCMFSFALPFFPSVFFQVNELDVSRVGTFTLQDYAASDAEAVSIMLQNRKSFGRVTVESDFITLHIDVVLPKKEWKIAEADFGTFSHINLNFVSIKLSSTASGILGDTQLEDFAFKPVSHMYTIFCIIQYLHICTCCFWAVFLLLFFFLKRKKEREENHKQ